eukprot:Ihof_evm2s314 gene=Ihof_evmTU2s314
MVADSAQIKSYVDNVWDQTIVPTLEEYIRVPNQSPMFDPEWNTNGYMMKAVDVIVQWIKKQPVKGLTVEVIKEADRSPLILIEVAATKAACSKDMVLLYGHMDKQPPMDETWDPKFGGPCDPRVIDGKLYGRGGADDGYSSFAAVTSIAALQAQGLDHCRCVITIEACEESGSKDLPHYLEVYAERIGTPSLIVCLDSGCGTYNELWLTTSLRGAVTGSLRVDVLSEGVHSGKASGIVPSSFRIMRQLLARLEDQNTGEILVKELQTVIPPHRLEEAKKVAEVLGDSIPAQYPWATSNSKPVATDNYELLLNGSWRPTMCVTGMEGLPKLCSAGNVLRAYTAAKLAFRVPPNGDCPTAARAIKEILEKDTPYGAKVTFDFDKCGCGFDAPKMSPWLQQAVEKASMDYFNKPVMMTGEGGSIPLMGLLAEKFPKAEFLVTGVLGPN